MLVGWDEYLKVSNACDTFHECCRRCRPAFERHRTNIQCAVEVTRPKTVACLGAGAFNDIPYEFMVRLGASIHLVNWTLLSYRSASAPLPQPADRGERGNMQDRHTSDERAEDISSHRVLQTRTQ